MSAFTQILRQHSSQLLKSDLQIGHDCILPHSIHSLFVITFPPPSTLCAERMTYHFIQGDQKVSVHLMITVKKKQKYFKQFQSLTMVT
jgi:hypothetical protein